MSTPVEPDTPEWTELVAEGRARVGGSNWFLGDAALKIAPMGDDGVNSGVFGNLERFADEVGVEYHSIREYRRVAAAWPGDTRLSPSTSWKVHSILASRPHLIREGMTVTQAHAAAGQQITGRTGPQSTAKDKAAAALQLLADPFVIAAMEPEARDRLADSLDAAAHPDPGIEEGQRAQRRHDHEEAAHDDPGPLYVQAMVLFAEVVDGVDQHRWSIDRATEVLTEGADRLTRMRDEMTTRKEFEEITGGT